MRALYDVDADVAVHGATGHLVVVPRRASGRGLGTGRTDRAYAMKASTLEASDVTVAPTPARSVRRRLLTVVPLFGLLTLVVLLVAPTLGSTPICLARVFDPSIPWADNVDAQIFFVARLPRVLAGALVGSTLAAAGVVLQALLRNPLATPFTLGVSASAALGAMLAIAFDLDASVLRAPPCRPPASPASLVGTAIVYFLATRVGGGLSTNVLLLAGVTLNTFFSALITFVQYLVDFADWYRTARWLLGNLDVSSLRPDPRGDAAHRRRRSCCSRCCRAR